MTDSATDPTTLHGPQGLTAEDTAYAGSRWAEVREAMLDDPYQPVWGAPGAAPFPAYESTLGQVFRGFLPFGQRDELKQAAIRTVESRADLRWGEDRKGFRRILHPNGICLFGLWEITGESGFSGYFRRGSRGLIVSRLSPNGSATRRGSTRSIGLTGKIYPTTDEDHAEPLRPANFFTQQDLGGAKTLYLDEAELRNAPDTHAFQGLARAVILGRLGALFGKVDEVPDVRQLHEVAELGKPAGEPTRAPKFMRLTVAAGQPRIEGDDLDFRDEVYGAIYDRGDPQPKRTLAFDIEVSDTGRSKGPAPLRTVRIENWQRIGRITYDRCVASFNADHVIHFHHPSWRTDRNDPATAVRMGGGG